jgi:hypothetical protein
MTPLKRPLLPSHSLYWTSIAYVLWDDFDPNLLDLDQQRAMLDWLHWGGQLILSGPDTLETLRGSFLGPYLPATAAGTRAITADDLSPLSPWSGRQEKPLNPIHPWTGVKFQKHEQARFLPDTGDLLVERNVGRGRIVASAFRLFGSELTRWPGYDNLFNACLMRRPARHFAAKADGSALTISWAGSANAFDPLDPSRNTKVRYFARDAGVSPVPARTKPIHLGHDNDPFNTEEEEPPPDQLMAGPGLAAWNDFSPVAQDARAALVNASGIHVPEPSFVLWVVAGYLIVLVPVNYAVFRLIGRIEWAWLAAPVIAIVCTLVVIKGAELNVGFARAQNEIDLVELHADYRRAHVSRYAVLYTSLTTRYEFDVDDPGGLVMPFPSVERPQDFALDVWEGYQTLACRRDDHTHVSGLKVDSNLVKFVHGEELIDLGGAISPIHVAGGGLQVKNQTAHVLHEVRVIRKTAQGDVEIARPDSIPPDTTTLLTFEKEQPANEDAAKGATGVSPVPDRNTGEMPVAPGFGEPTGELSIRTLVWRAVDAKDFRPGQVRLVARLDDLPGLQVRPGASQVRQATLLIAHLDEGTPPKPEMDANVRRDVDPYASSPNDSDPNTDTSPAPK